MAVILRRSRLSWKPLAGTAALDPSHPLSIELRAFYLLNDQAGQMLDLGPFRRNGTRTGAVRTAVGGPHGQVLDYAGGSGDLVDVGTWSVVTNAMTLMAWMYWDAFDSGRDDRLISKADGGNANQHDWMIGKTDSSGPKLRCRFNRSVNTAIGSTTTITTGAWHHCVATVADVGGQLTSNLTLDGVPQVMTGTNQHGAGPLPNNTDLIYLGNQPSGATSAPDGRLSLCAIWGRKLTDSEILWLYTQPFDMLTPRVVRRYVDYGAAAGGVTVSGALIVPAAVLSAAAGITRSATGALIVPAAVLAAAATVARTAAGALVTPAPVLAATVDHFIPVSAALQVPAAVLAAAATITREATGDLTTPAATLAATATIQRDVSGALVVPAAVLSAFATAATVVSGSLIVPVTVLAAEGTVTRTVVGTLIVPAAVLAATATRAPLVSGVLVVPAARLAAQVQGESAGGDSGSSVVVGGLSFTPISVQIGGLGGTVPLG